jgi:hypothetical protein
MWGWVGCNIGQLLSFHVFWLGCVSWADSKESWWKTLPCDRRPINQLQIGSNVSIACLMYGGQLPVLKLLYNVTNLLSMIFFNYFRTFSWRVIIGHILSWANRSIRITLLIAGNNFKRQIEISLVWFERSKELEILWLARTSIETSRVNSLGLIRGDISYLLGLIRGDISCLIKARRGKELFCRLFCV